MFKNIEGSSTLSRNEKSKEIESQGKTVYKYGFGESPFHTPSWVVNKLSLHANANFYSNVQGTVELREAMAAFHKEFFGMKFHPDDIIIGPGSKIIMYNFLSILQTCDVLLPMPCWNSYERQAAFLGHNVIWVQSSYEERWRVNSHNLTLALKQKKHAGTVLFLNFPGNPDGLNYTDEELKAIATLAREHSISVISDEIYGLLSFDRKQRTFSDYYPEKTIVISGLSKWCGSGGWRIGACFLPTANSPYKMELKSNMLGIASQTYACASTPIQIAATEAYCSFALAKTYFEKQTGILEKISQFCYNELREAGVRLHEPQGAFYLFLDFESFRKRFLNDNIYNSAVLCDRILEEANVMLTPGNDFGVPGSYFTARLAYVDFKFNADEAGEFDLYKHAPKIVGGIKKLADWLGIRDKTCGLSK